MLKLPEYFENDKESRIIENKGIKVAEYKVFKQKYIFNINLNEDMLVFVIKGKKIIQSRAMDITLNKGEGIYLQKGNYVMSQILELEDETYQSFLVFINDHFLENAISEIIEFEEKNTIKQIDYPLCHRFKTNPFINSCIDSFAPYFIYESSINKNILNMKMKELLIHLTNNDQEGLLKSYLLQIYRDHRQFDIVDYMNRNFTAPLTVEEFAKKTNRSLSAFKKDFKKIFNQPPKEWINKQRLATARGLIKNTDKNITDISFLVGYENYSYFIQLFKQEYGTTPKQYQKSNRISEN